MNPSAASPVPPGDRCPQCGHEVNDAWLVCAWCGRALAAPAELVEGARLSDGRYQILGVIGRGGFGITYDVGDRRLQRRVAMKELFPESAVRHGSLVLTPPEGRAGFRAARDRFLREARVLARFTHPGIVRVYEVFEEHGTAYLVMELLQGRTLIELLQERGRPFATDEVLDVAGRVAAALRPVHAAGVLHRDINPSNVMMTHHGRIVVIDFGLARDYDQERTVGMTRVVTPGYAPIEQYRGEGRFGPSTDVYGLAATCYRLATGKVPVSALEREGGAHLPSPHSLNPAISKPVSDAILDGLELEPTHRPQDLDGFLSRLGIKHLPEGPRSILLDTVPPPAPPAEPVAVEPPFAAVGTEAPTSATEIVRPAPAERWDAGPDATRPAPAEVAGAWAPGGGDTAVAGWSGGPDATRHASSEAGAGGPRTIVAGPTSSLAPPPPAPMPAPWAPEPLADARLPLAIGPHRPGRRKVLLPLFLVALATASAAPVLMTLLVVLVVLPGLATLGDSVAHRMRSERGIASGWAERRLAPGTLAPARFVRNLVGSTLRASPLIGIGAVLVAGWYALERFDVPRSLLDLALRAIGVLVVGLAVLTQRDGSSRFRTGLGLDELTARLVPGGHTSERVVVFWLVAAMVVIGALWLSPAPFPLPVPAGP